MKKIFVSLLLAMSIANPFGNVVLAKKSVNENAGTVNNAYALEHSYTEHNTQKQSTKYLVWIAAFVITTNVTGYAINKDRD